MNKAAGSRQQAAVRMRGIVGMCSHMGPLTAAFNASSGDVLELGCGAYSTLLLHWMCGQAGRGLYTLDSDRLWIERLAAYERPWHGIGYTPTPQDSRLIERSFGLAFVDNAADERGPCLQRLHHVPIIVVHDTEQRHLCQYPGFEAALKAYRYRLDVQPPFFRNQTSIISDSVDVASLLGSIA